MLWFPVNAVNEIKKSFLQNNVVAFSGITATWWSMISLPTIMISSYKGWVVLLNIFGGVDSLAGRYEITSRQLLET